MLYKIFIAKRYLEQVIMFPFVLLGKWLSIKHPLLEEYDIFFFFPGYAIGGAERVNVEIVKSLPEKKIIIFFTKKSANDGMRHLFNLPNVTIRDISLWTDNKFRYWNNLLYRGICSNYINRQKNKPVVFIGQCNFGYKLTPHLKKDINIFELIHMLDKRFTWVWAPFIKFIKTRVVIAEYFKNTFIQYYDQLGIPQKYTKRITVIKYCLEETPSVYARSGFNLPLSVYYGGRGGPQKRIWIIIKIIRACIEKKLPVTFKLAGSFKDELPPEFSEDNNIYVGEIKGGKAMYEFHKENDILLMTSAWEGFPIVIMEAMACGSVALTVDVDAIPEFIKSNENGFLISNNMNENEIVKDAVERIAFLCNHPGILNDVSKNAFHYAATHFSPDVFRKAYRNLLLKK